MMNWFETLEQRERLFVIAGAAVVAIVLLYAVIWMPLDKGHKTVAASVASWEQSLAALRPLRGAKLSSGNSNRTSASGVRQTPVVIVDRTLRARGLDRFLKRSQPTSSNGIRVEFENVAFDELVVWLGDLSEQYTMHVSSGSLSSANQTSPGRINATFTLERSL